jgi:hypothetical protein
MATYSATQAKTVTCVAAQVDTITLTGTGQRLRFEQNSSTPIYFTLAQPGQTPATPTVAGDNCYAIMNGNNADNIIWNGNGVVIKLITAGTGVVNFALHG